MSLIELKMNGFGRLSAEPNEVLMDHQSITKLLWSGNDLDYHLK